GNHPTGVGLAIPFTVCIQKQGNWRRAFIRMDPPHGFDPAPVNLRLALYRNGKLVDAGRQHREPDIDPGTKWKTPWVRTKPGHFCAQLQNQYSLDHYEVLGQVGHDSACGNTSLGPY